MASGDRANTSRKASDLSESPSPQSKKDQGKTAKAGSSKKMTKKEQSERFVETARQLQIDENQDENFERALRTILRE